MLRLSVQALGATGSLLWGGGIGLLLLGVLDGSVVPSFGTLDQFAGILAARNEPLWFYYAVMSTLGAMIGASVHLFLPAATEVSINAN